MHAHLICNFIINAKTNVKNYLLKAKNLNILFTKHDLVLYMP